jgi:hypothetical protein
MTKVCRPLREHVSGLPCLWHGRSCSSPLREVHHEPYRSHGGNDVRGLIPLCQQAHRFRHDHPAEFLERITREQMAAASAIAWALFCKRFKLGPKAEEAGDEQERWQILEKAGMVSFEGKPGGTRPLTKTVNKF